MLRLSVLALALAPLTAASLAAPVPKSVEKPVLYFPTTVGAKWVYRGGSTDRVEQVTAVEEKDGEAGTRSGGPIHSK